MKKGIVVFVVLSVVLGLLSGCGIGGAVEEKEITHKEYVSEVTDLSTISIGPFGWPVDQAIDYTKPYNKRFDGLVFTEAVGGNGSDLPDGMSVDDNTFTWMLEARTGLKRQTIWTASGDGFKAKLNQAITANELPDLMMVDLNQYRTLVKSGLIADLTDELLNGNHPTLRGLYAKNNNKALDTITIDGRIYGIPMVGADYDGSPLIWIRSDWLEKLGLKEPESLEDLTKIAAAFIEQDPDGNGLDDTYGVIATAVYSVGGEGSLQNMIINIGGAVPGTWQTQQDGTIMYGSLMPGAKEALKFLNEWYNDGILPEDFATWGTSDLHDAIGNDKAGIVFGPWYSGVLGLNNSITLNTSAEWEAFLLPKEAGGQVSAAKGDPISGIYVVSKSFEYPEAFVYAYDMIESFGNEFNSEAPDPRFVYRNCEGYQSISTTYNPISSPVAPDYYTSPIDTVCTAMGGADKLSSYNSIEGIIEKVAETKTTPVMEIFLQKNTYPGLACAVAKANGENPRETVYGDMSAVATYQAYLLYWTGPKALYDANPDGKSTDFMGLVPSMELYSSFLNTFEIEAYTRMIMGDTDGLSIDDYFEKFVSDYLAHGGQAITDEVNALIHG